MIDKYTQLIEECITKGKWGKQAQQYIKTRHPTTPTKILNQIPVILTQPALYETARINMHQHYTQQIQDGIDPITAAKQTQQLYPWYWNPEPDTPQYIRRVIPYTMHLITHPEYIAAGAAATHIYQYAKTHIGDVATPLFIVPVLEAAMKTLRSADNKRLILGHLLLWPFDITTETILPRQVVDGDLGDEAVDLRLFMESLLGDLGLNSGRAIALSDLVRVAGQAAPGLFEVWLRRACDVCGVRLADPDSLLRELFELDG